MFFAQFVKYSLLVVIISTSQVQAMSSHCQGIFVSAKDELSKIHQSLKAVSNKDQYQSSVKARYDTVETLLIMSENCEGAKSNSGEERKDWMKLRATLSKLHTNAQASAFTKFENWLSAKETDLSAFTAITISSTILTN